MSELTQSVTRLINEFAKLPGIGKKSAERLTYHILRIHRNEALELADAIRSVKENVQYCSKCYNLAEGEECAICRDPSRQQDVLCVVEQPRDLMALGTSGRISRAVPRAAGEDCPFGWHRARTADDRRPGAVGFAEGGFKEVIMATNPTVEGDGTALHISNLLSGLPVHITRLARGITSGSVLEFANKEILADALTGRQKF